MAQRVIATAVFMAVLTASGCGSNVEESPGSAVSRSAASEELLDLHRQSVPRGAVSHLIAAQDAMRAQRYRLALSRIDSALAVRDSLADAYFLRGRVLSTLGRIEDANEAYRRVAERFPSYPGVWLNLANNLSRAGELRMAARRYHEALRHHPREEVYTYLGRLYNNLDEIDSARWALRRAMRRDTTDPSPYLYYAQMLGENGSPDSALWYARRGLSRGASNPQYRYLVGRLFLETGRLDSAASYLRDVVRTRPTHRGANYNLGQALLRLGRESEAQRYLERADSLQRVLDEIERVRSATEANPGRVGNWLQLARTLEEYGRRREALNAYVKARAQSSSSPELDRHIQRLRRGVGATDE